MMMVMVTLLLLLVLLLVDANPQTQSERVGEKNKDNFFIKKMKRSIVTDRWASSLMVFFSSHFIHTTNSKVRELFYNVASKPLWGSNTCVHYSIHVHY